MPPPEADATPVIYQSLYSIKKWEWTEGGAVAEIWVSGRLISVSIEFSISFKPPFAITIAPIDPPGSWRVLGCWDRRWDLLSTHEIEDGGLALIDCPSCSEDDLDWIRRNREWIEIALLNQDLVHLPPGLEGQIDVLVRDQSAFGDDIGTAD